MQIGSADEAQLATTRNRHVCSWSWYRRLWMIEVELEFVAADALSYEVDGMICSGEMLKEDERGGVNEVIRCLMEMMMSLWITILVTSLV